MNDKQFSITLEALELLKNKELLRYEIVNKYPALWEEKARVEDRVKLINQTIVKLMEVK